MKIWFKIILFLCCGMKLTAQQVTERPFLYAIEPAMSVGKIVKNAPEAPNSHTTVFSEINFTIQTDGRRDWHQFYNFPKIGLLVPFGGLGNRKDLGQFIGLAPNMVLNAHAQKWYVPKVALGLGIAYFTNPYKMGRNTTNFYIGSAITALGYASLYIQPKLSERFSLKAGVSIIHCSNGHVQIPNLGINLPSVFLGLVYRQQNFPSTFEKHDVGLPKSKIQFNIRLGLGVHQLARTTEPIGTAKYAVYVTDFYLSRRFGKISNVSAGIEINHYNSYYRYIAAHDFFSSNQKLKATVVTIFLGHELMMGHVGLLAQGGINVYNPFYIEYIKMYKSDKGIKSVLKKYISTRLGFQYYLWDPKYCTRSNMFIGAYIKANFGQADFICSQIGFVF